MIKVEARRGESGERLLARFKKIVNKDGILKELKRRARYEKPSERRRRKAKERIKNLRKAEGKQKEGHVFKKQKDRRARSRSYED